MDKDCTHDLAERETAAADGCCPICLRARVAQLEQELHAQAVCDCHTWPTVKEFHEYTLAVEAERDSLREAVRNYGHHQSHCDVHRQIHNWRDCTCGFWKFCSICKERAMLRGSNELTDYAAALAQGREPAPQGHQVSNSTSGEPQKGGGN